MSRRLAAGVSEELVDLTGLVPNVHVTLSHAEQHGVKARPYAK